MKARAPTLKLPHSYASQPFRHRSRWAAPFVLAVAALLSSSAAFAGAIRMIEFTARDFRTSQDNPNDFRSGGDPFGIFGLAQPAQISGYVTFDTAAAPLLGPTALNPGDPQFAASEVWLPYVALKFILGPNVELSAVRRGLGDAMLVRDGIGTGAFDNLWLQNTSNQTLANGIEIDMQIQLVGGPSNFSGLNVPTAATFNAVASSMPSYDERLLITMFDTRGNVHTLRAFDVTFRDVGAVPEPPVLGLLGIAMLILLFAPHHRFRHLH